MQPVCQRVEYAKKHCARRTTRAVLPAIEIRRRDLAIDRHQSPSENAAV
jgi:hypothetical protein